MTNASLRYWYRVYRQKYFKGELPNAKVMFKKMKEMGVCILEDRTIYIDKKLRGYGVVTKLTLLHEMVHLSLPAGNYHNTRFQKRMLKLAKEGAFKTLW